MGPSDDKYVRRFVQTVRKSISKINTHNICVNRYSVDLFPIYFILEIASDYTD